MAFKARRWIVAASVLVSSIAQASGVCTNAISFSFNGPFLFSPIEASVVSSLELYSPLLDRWEWIDPDQMLLAFDPVRVALLRFEMQDGTFHRVAVTPKFPRSLVLSTNRMQTAVGDKQYQDIIELHLEQLQDEGDSTFNNAASIVRAVPSFLLSETYVFDWKVPYGKLKSITYETSDGYKIRYAFDKSIDWEKYNEAGLAAEPLRDEELGESKKVPRKSVKEELVERENAQKNVVWDRRLSKQLMDLPPEIQKNFIEWVDAINALGLATVQRQPGRHDKVLMPGKTVRKLGDRVRSARLSGAYRARYVELGEGKIEVRAVNNFHD